MALLTLSFGILPSREQFDEAWEVTDEAGELRNGLFSFGRDPRLGDCALRQSQLWNELLSAHAEYESGEADLDDENGPGPWLSSVLSCLSIEWI